MTYKLAVFDMDGTILDSLGDLRDCLNAALAACGLPTRTTEEVRTFVGNGIRTLVERGAGAGATAEQIERVFDFYNEYYAVHCADTTRPYAGVCDLLAKLRAAGLKTAVVSNKSDYAVQSLCQTYFDGLFDGIIGIREGLAKKPAPDAVLAVMRELGVERGETVYVGDSNVDVETARNTGIPCLSVTWGFRTREELLACGADRFVDTMDELADALLD